MDGAEVCPLYGRRWNRCWLRGNDFVELAVSEPFWMGNHHFLAGDWLVGTRQNSVRRP